MADELTINASVRYAKNGAAFTRNAPATAITVTGDHVVCGTQSIGFAAAENIAKGDITTSGYMLVHNTDATNFVQIGYDDTGFKPTVKLLAGEWSLFRSAQATLQAQADTGACIIEYYLFEA